jgi:hypothetical protein
MTHYMLSVIDSTESYDMPIEQAQPIFEATGAFNKKIQADGTWVFSGGLERLETATVVDGTRDDVVVTDGPFAEAKEYLGGFWVIEAPDLDAALKIAAEGSKACRSKIEIRPFHLAE